MTKPLISSDRKVSPETFRIGLAGNPNSGKTSLFNALTGTRQNVGNYPGVTVEKRSGTCTAVGRRVEVLDLPGTYSLTSFSPEEQIARDEVLDGRHDVVVVVVDSTTLHRSLVLLAQVMQTGARTVLCLNMADEAEKAGQRIDVDLMEQLLGFPVVQTVAHKGIGIRRLMQAVISAAGAPSGGRSRLVLGDRMDRAVAAIRDRLDSDVAGETARDWVATRLLIGDSGYVDRIEGSGTGGREAIEEAERQLALIESETRQKIDLYVTRCYYGFVDGLLREVVLRPAKADMRLVSDAVDRVLVHRILGLPIFAAVLFTTFWITFTLGEPPMEWIETGFRILGDRITGFWQEGTASPLRSLLVDGIINGVGGVIVFLPNILLLFFGLAFLEDTGYMARVAFLMDRVMHRFGLHGKSFVPMMIGFGCSIPGIMATRTLENERDRLTTMLVLPLMSCGARLPIWMLLIPAFFSPPWRAPMLWFIYTFGIVMALLLALLLRKSILKGEEAPFVMELPPYRIPTVKAIATKIMERAWLYLRKAGTVILGISILMWFITAYPKKQEYNVHAGIAAGTIHLSEEEIEDACRAEDLDYSIAGRIGRFVEPVLEPLGFDWKIGTAMIGAFAAKEVFVAQMGIVHSMGEADEESRSLREILARDYTPLVGLSLILFLLISAPCMATVAVTRRESGRWRWALLQFGGLTVVAYGVSLVVFQVGRLVT